MRGLYRAKYMHDYYYFLKGPVFFNQGYMTVDSINKVLTNRYELYEDSELEDRTLLIPGPLLNFAFC